MNSRSLGLILISKFICMAMRLKRLFFILLGTSALCFLLYRYVLNDKNSLWKSAEILEIKSNPGLLIDTPGCKLPKLDPYDRTLKKLIANKGEYSCPGNPSFLILKPNSTILLNETVLNIHYKLKSNDTSCWYQNILRPTEPPKSKRENSYSFGEKKKLEFSVPLGMDHIVVNCDLAGKQFTQYIPLVPIKNETQTGRSEINRNTSSVDLNVILFGIDSVSKLNFLRQFKKTRLFLEQHLSPFELKGYTKVGDNTFPNLTPLLTGHFIEYYWNESVKDTMAFDDVDLIWKTFSRKGYRTFYAEDSPLYGTFNYLKRGFKQPPTDYYYRPLALAIDGSALKKKSKTYCIGSQLEVDILHNYLRDFVITMHDRPYFAFLMVSTLTHNYLNFASYADEPTFRLLKKLWEIGAFNESLLILFSDHGIRFGAIRQTYIGKFEERMPFIYVYVPPKFLEKYPQFAKNLWNNQNRLTTPFDIHATMVHLLHLDQKMSQKERLSISPNGLSLFSEISEYRTCEQAKILPHWCPCQVYEYKPIDDPLVVKAAAAIIEKINRLLQPYQFCSALHIDKITDARSGKANEKVLRFVKNEHDVLNRRVIYGNKVAEFIDYLITLTAKPGGGRFEGTVRYDAQQSTFNVLGISRINMYGQQSWCVDVQDLKKFCFCKF
ncbi:uncharacterized protein LOC118198221 [Stegodyphus dumicola]|uniref:uncharacterized protein LOC118198221 n=1 Tax=Stegodyphus dumicola TaxID=202533 RepID=UPI0015AB3327|nr:uncharacterized protein LOC118198221 [Stegodyphus dumicola]XP_035225735.1 uncharacterized protein LOC118198221 [Stegodyphus dumicola]